jgi:hypothetical protein
MSQMSECKEKRGLPNTLYVNARLLQFAKLIGMTSDRICQNQADLDRAVRSVEKFDVFAYHDGKWQPTVRRSILPELWVPVTKSASRASLKSSKRSDLGNALLLRAIANIGFENHWFESRVDAKSGKSYLFASFADHSSVNTYIIRFSLDGDGYRIQVKGVGNAAKRRKKKRVGKTNSHSSQKVDVKTASVEKASSTIDSSTKDSRVKKAMELRSKVDRTGSRSSSGYER